jgi:outer membrane protein assembly factor BamB
MARVRWRSAAAVVCAGVLAAMAAGGPATAETALLPRDWPQFGRTADHTGVAGGKSFFKPANISGLAVAWAGVFGPHAASESSVVVSGGVAYIAGFDGRIYAFPLDGCGASLCPPAWYGKTRNDITATPAVAGDNVLVASADHRLYAFPTSGCASSPCPPAWAGTLGSAVVESSVTVAGTTAYVGGYDGKLYAFAATGCGQPSCKPLWTGNAGASHGQAVAAAPTVAGDTVLVASVDKHLYAFPAAGCGEPACQPEWRAAIGGPAYGTAPTVSGDTIYVVGEKADELLAYSIDGCNAAMCQPLWHGSLGFFPSGSTTPAVSNGVVYVASQGSPSLASIGVVSAFDADGCGAPTCQPLWTGINFGSGFESSPAVAGNIVFVAKGPASGFPVDAGIYAYDARGCGQPSCAPLAFVQVGEQELYLGSSVAVSGDKVLFASEDNSDNRDKLYVLTVPAG